MRRACLCQPPACRVRLTTTTTTPPPPPHHSPSSYLLPPPSLLPSVRGEDYCFSFSGKLRDGRFHFRLHMQWEGDGDGDVAPPGGEAGSSKTIDFVYDPDTDTPGGWVGGWVGRSGDCLACLSGYRRLAHGGSLFISVQIYQRPSLGLASAAAASAVSLPISSPHNAASLMPVLPLPPASPLYCCTARRRDCSGD